MTLIIRVAEDQVVPAWYGVAWFDFSTNHAHAAPLPLVLPIVIGRWLWSSLRLAARDVARDPRTAYLEGYEAGIQFARTHPHNPGFIYPVKAGNRCRMIQDSPSSPEAHEQGNP